MRKYWLRLAALLLAGCQSQPTETATAVAHPDSVIAAADAGPAGLPGAAPARPVPVWWTPQPREAFRLVDSTNHHWERVHPAPPRLTVGRLSGYHRYRGTLAGWPLTLDFIAQLLPDSLDCFYQNSSYHFDQDGKLHALAPLRPTPAGGWRLAELGSDQDTVAVWEARQPLGAVLTGQRRDGRTRELRPFQLRESYAGAVRYELISEVLRGDTLWRDFGDGELMYHDLCLDHQTLHLLGPDTLQPGLRRLQCLPPGRRRRLRREWWHQSRASEGRMGNRVQLTVELNEHGILVVRSANDSDYGRASSGSSQELFDLATGRPREAAAWLRPSQRAHLWAHLIRLARLDSQFHGLHPARNYRDWPPRLGLSTEGLTCDLSEVTPLDYHEYGLLTIPYSQLAPYVRPGTPLARLVAARTRARR